MRKQTALTYFLMVRLLALFLVAFKHLTFIIMVTSVLMSLVVGLFSIHMLTQHLLKLQMVCI